MYSRGYICLIFLFVTFLTGAVGDFCFRVRVPSGPFGQCQEEIPNTDTAEDCCLAGGTGWTTKQNGKRCSAACPDNFQPPVIQPEPTEAVIPPQAAEDEEVKFCFRTREPRGNLGACEDLIGESTREACCRQGGKGWTERRSGRRCGDACFGVNDPGPVWHCFGRRTARGRCVDSLGEKTRLRCCQDGGIGWSANENGRACQTPCEEPPPVVIHGGWSDWDDWGQCSVSCGEGTQRRRRRCNNPEPANGGDDCVGSAFEEAVCDEGPCPIDGGWGRWRRAGGCSATCYNDGQSVYRQMRRECDDPLPQFGGLPCQGAAIKNIRCSELPHCPVDGGWSAYGEWSECSQTCDEGIQIRQRTCTNPRPLYEGRECEGIDTEQKVCRNRRVCPIHGGWSNWGRWSPCNSPRCGVDGKRFRFRNCTNPKPEHRGNYCAGKSKGEESCSKCATPGGWSDWSPWGPCTGNCGQGDFRRRIRICNNPLPQNGGSCEGDYQDIGECANLDPCPNSLGEGSGSGEMSGTPLSWLCDDEDSCNPGAVNPDEGDSESSFSYSDERSVDVSDDIAPEQTEECEEVEYSLSAYNDPAGCQNNGVPDVVHIPVVVDNSLDYGEGSDSYSFDDEEDNGGQDEAQPSAPHDAVEEYNDGSDSYSFDDAESDGGQDGAQPSAPQDAVEEYNDGSDSYSFDDGESNGGQDGAQPSAPRGSVEENNGVDNYSYSFDDEEGDGGQDGAQPSAPQGAVEENNGVDNYSYSFDYEEDDGGQDGAQPSAPQGAVEENNVVDNYSYSFDNEGNVDQDEQQEAAGNNGQGGINEDEYSYSV